MKSIKEPLLFAFCCVMTVAILFRGQIPYAFAYDPNDEKCLPDLHLAFLVKKDHTTPSHGDYVFWTPSGILSYVKQKYVLKQVAGIPGDHLTIKDGKVLINKAVVVTGFPLSNLYHHVPKDFERDEIIPAGQTFMIGTNPLSNDSRYWGYLSIDAIKGTGYEVF